MYVLGQNLNITGKNIKISGHGAESKVAGEIYVLVKQNST
uniref:Uncharacterized protein n=1 Tax=Arundo donax TaxID=35708 RepID=A0A0A9CNX1_ARUDO